MLNVSPAQREQSVSNTLGSASLDVLSEVNLTGAAGVAAGGDGSEVEDIEELFGQIDWATANFSELEAQWRAELAAIEKDNVTALLQSSERGQTVLPAVNMAIGEISKVEELVLDYNRQLKMMGQEISQIAEINQSLDTQAKNQQALLAELNKILGSLEIPNEALQVLMKPSFAPDLLPTVLMAAQLVYGVLHTKFDRGIKDIRAVAERLDAFRSVMAHFEEALLAHLIALLKAPTTMAGGGKRKGDRLKPHRLDAINQSLQPMANLIQMLGKMSPIKYADFRTAYESISRSIMTTEMAEIIEYLKANNLAARTPDEKPSFLLSSNRPSSSFDTSKFYKGKDFSGFKAFGTEDLPELVPHDKLLPEQLLEYMVLLAVETSGNLFEAVQTIFYPDETQDSMLKVAQILDNIFTNMQDLLVVHVAESLMKNDRLSAFPFIAMIERRLPEIGPEIAAMDVTLRTMLDRCTRTALEHTNAQVEAIKESRFSAKKRSGVSPFVSIFPKFVQVLEQSIQGAPPTGKARAIVNTAYESISGVIFASLASLTLEASQTDDEKDNLNANIMTVQNTYSLMDDLKSMNIPALETILKRSKEEFAKNLASYASLSLPRVLGKLPDFFEAIHKLLQTSSPEEIAFHAAYDKASARRVISAWPPKEARKGVESLYERVLKHFKGGSDGDALVPLVWAALQQHVKEKVEGYVQIISQVYPASDIQLLFSADEIASYFRDFSR